MANISIGRAPKCSIVVDPSYESVSRTHATFSDQTGQLVLQDHSTYVNGQLYHNQSVVIRQGDVIMLGQKYGLPWSDILPFFILAGKIFYVIFLTVFMQDL